MSQPVIELICDSQQAGIDEVRLRLRNTMQTAGYLPHWKETFEENKISSPIILHVSNTKVWEGDVNSFLNLPEERLLRLLQQKTRLAVRWKLFIKSQFSFFIAVLIAFFPKCPFCWAAYMSVFSSLGLGRIPYKPWLLPVLIALLFMNLLSLYLSRNRHGYKPIVLAIIGAGLVTLNRLYWQDQLMMIIGAACLVGASLWNSLSRRMSFSVKYYLMPSKRKAFE